MKKLTKKEILRRKRISETMKGRKPTNLETLHSLPRTKEWRKNIGQYHKGKKLSEETKRKISNSKRNPLRPIHIAIRQCYKYREWRSSIFERDNFTCLICKKRGGQLNVDHHPKRFVDIVNGNGIISVEQALQNKELWNLDNGRTLCVKCHTKTDTYGFRVTKVTG